MPGTDIAVLVVIVVGTVFLTHRLWRNGARGMRYAVTLSLCFLGLVLVATMTAHLVDILYKLSHGTTPQGALFRYDFRVYSLLLLGVLLAAAGLFLLRSGGGIGRGAGSLLAARRIVVGVLLLVVPLIPIQAFFAIPLSVIAGICLTLLLLSKNSLAVAQRVEPARSP